MENMIETRVEEGAFCITGKVMYSGVEVGSDLNYLWFGNMFRIYKF